MGSPTWGADHRSGLAGLSGAEKGRLVYAGALERSRSQSSVVARLARAEAPSAFSPARRIAGAPMAARPRSPRAERSRPPLADGCIRRAESRAGGGLRCDNERITRASRPRPALARGATTYTAPSSGPALAGAPRARPSLAPPDRRWGGGRIPWRRRSPGATSVCSDACAPLPATERQIEFHVLRPLEAHGERTHPLPSSHRAAHPARPPLLLQRRGRRDRSG